MSAWLIALCGVIYLYVAVEQMWRGDAWLGGAFLFYACANVCFVMQAWKALR